MKSGPWSKPSLVLTSPSAAGLAGTYPIMLGPVWRSVCLLTALAAVLETGSALAQSATDMPAPVWSSMRLPGTSANYARVLGLDPTTERSRIVLDAIRLIHNAKPGINSSGNLLLEKETRYFDLLDQLANAVAHVRSPQGTISLKPIATKKARN
jgi:hypothetical protein